MQRRDFLASAVVGVISFLLYLRTLAPTITAEDAGELIAAAYTLGIPHPPGYPLYCLLAKMFTFFPFSDIAYRVNLMSTVFGALSISVFYLLVLQVTQHPLSAAIASLLFAFSKELWAQSLIAEVYTLNLFFALLTLFFLLRWKQTHADSFLWATLLTFGFSLTHHWPLMGLALPGYLVLLFWGDVSFLQKRFADQKQWLTPLLCLCLPLLVYLYLPIRSAANPPMDWGNPETLETFFAHVSRSAYKGLELAQPVTLQIKLLFLFYFVGLLFQQFTPWLLPFAGLGLKRLFDRDRKLAWTTATLFLCNTVLLLFVLHFAFTRENSQRVVPYFLPAYGMVAVWLGCGIKGAMDWLNLRLNAFPLPSWKRATVPKVSGALMFLLPLFPLTANWHVNDKSDAYLARDFALALLDSVAPKAILFPSGDYQTFPLAYLTMVEGKRKDVLIANVYGTLHQNLLEEYRRLTKDKKPRTDEEIQAALIQKSRRPIYYASKSEFPSVPGYTLRPEGLWYRVVKDEKKKPHPSPKGNPNFWKHLLLRRLHAPLETLDDMERSIVADYWFFLGLYFLEQGKTRKGLECFEKVAEVASDNEIVFNNLGSACAEYGFLKQAEGYYKRAIRLYPDYLTPHANLGRLYEGQGRLDDAIAFYQEALRIDPSREDVRQRLQVLISKLESVPASVATPFSPSPTLPLPPLPSPPKGLPLPSLPHTQGHHHHYHGDRPLPAHPHGGSSGGLPSAPSP